jgi:hypothetical protein
MRKDKDVNIMGVAWVKVWKIPVLVTKSSPDQFPIDQSGRKPGKLGHQSAHAEGQSQRG